MNILENPSKVIGWLGCLGVGSFYDFPKKFLLNFKEDYAVYLQFEGRLDLI